MDKWIIIHPTHLLPNPFMTQPAHLPPLLGGTELACHHLLLLWVYYLCQIKFVYHFFNGCMESGVNILDVDSVEVTE